MSYPAIPILLPYIFDCRYFRTHPSEHNSVEEHETLEPCWSLLVENKTRGKSVSLPSSILIPLCLLLPLLCQLNKDKCSLSATCSVRELGARICLFTDAGGRDAGVCRWRYYPKDNVRLCASWAPVWRITAFFRRFQ